VSAMFVYIIETFDSTVERARISVSSGHHVLWSSPDVAVIHGQI